jgi:hypothetical protein
VAPFRKRHFKAQRKDPLKGIGFLKAPKRGGDQELTEMEKKVLAVKPKKGKGPAAVFKQNVRKRRR